MYTMERLFEFIRQMLDSKGEHTQKLIPAELEQNEVERLSKLIGIDLTGFKRKIDSNGIRHVFKKHGDPGNESLRGQISVIEADFDLVEIIVREYDILIPGSSKLGNPTLRYEKSFPEFHLIYVEEVRPGRKEIMLQTLYKRKIRR